MRHRIHTLRKAKYYRARDTTLQVRKTAKIMFPFLGVFLIEDELRNEAKETIRIKGVTENKS